jgi:hypothetical protein
VWSAEFRTKPGFDINELIILMKYLVFLICMPFLTFSQIIHSEDSDLYIDSAQTAQGKLPLQPRLINPFIETSFGNIWLSYSEPLDFWHYSLELTGFGIASGIIIQPAKIFRIETGLRFHKSGNRINMYDEYYNYSYDSTDINPIDSEFTTLKGYFKQSQYYLSLPVTISLFVNKTPAFVLGGLELGYLLYASSLMKYSTNGHVYFNQEKDPMEYYQPFDIAVNLGTGINMSLSKHVEYDVCIVYSFGLRMINNPDLWMSNFKTREISIMVAFALR